MTKKIYLTYLIGLHLNPSTESNLIECDKNFRKYGFSGFTYPLTLIPSQLLPIIKVQPPNIIHLLITAHSQKLVPFHLSD